MTLTINKKAVTVLALVLFLGLFAAVAYANNSWSKYHWDKSTEESVANPLVLTDNTTPAWSDSLSGASSDWNLSVLLNEVVDGTNTACDPVIGQVEVCNDTYGTNGWLGIAQVWVYRGKDGHIAQALVKMNDTYFNMNYYNTPAWRNMVMCQEVGHTYGLDHQDETFDNANSGTCMDYTDDPDGTVKNQANNEHPNTHDYDELTEKYGHLNGVEEPKKEKGGGGGNKRKKPEGTPSGIDLNDASAWGQAVRFDARGNTSLFERNLGNGQVLLTYVIWVD